MRYADLVRRVRENGSPDAERILRVALGIAKEVHGIRDPRKTDSRLAHLFRVADTVAAWRAPVDVVAVGLLHETLEPRCLSPQARARVADLLGSAAADRIQAIGL